MKGFIRWLLRPLFIWLSHRVSFEVVQCADGQLLFVITDGFGVCWETVRTPDQIREKAWAMIGMADEGEQVAVLHDC